MVQVVVEGAVSFLMHPENPAEATQQNEFLKFLSMRSLEQKSILKIMMLVGAHNLRHSFLVTTVAAFARPLKPKSIRMAAASTLASSSRSHRDAGSITDAYGLPDEMRRTGIVKSDISKDDVSTPQKITLKYPTHSLKLPTTSKSYPKLEVDMVSSGSDLSQPVQVTLHSTVPNGFTIVDNEVFEGKKVIATKDFKKGDLLYITSCALLDLSAAGHCYKLKIYSEDANGKRSLLESHDNTDTHSVDDHAIESKTGATSKRQVYGFDSFMNHSCQANAYFPLLYRTSTEMCYQAIALSDIDAGTEVTCDYALFDYSCSGHEIEVCACGSKKCRGKMLGFQALPLTEKVGILHLCEEEIKEKFIATEAITTVFKSRLPPGVGIATRDGNDNYLVATRNFEVGDVVFKNSVQIIPKCDVASSKRYLLHVDGKLFYLLDSDHHFIHRAEYSEMLGFDSFMDHSCSPNTQQVYTNQEDYVVSASKPIRPGDKITCDYMALDSMGTDTFTCTCGESNCHGTLIS